MENEIITAQYEKYKEQFDQITTNAYNFLLNYSKK